MDSLYIFSTCCIKEHSLWTLSPVNNSDLDGFEGVQLSILLNTDVQSILIQLWDVSHQRCFTPDILTHFPLCSCVLLTIILSQVLLNHSTLYSINMYNAKKMSQPVNTPLLVICVIDGHIENAKHVCVLNTFFFF